MSEKEIIPTVFARRASGLVRRTSGWTIAAATFTYAIGAGVHVMATSANFTYPGGDVFLGFVISVLCMVWTTLSYIWLMAAMPRTGGDYIYISRIINPAIAFVATWGLFIANSVGMGFIAYWAVQNWGTAFTIAGSLTNNYTWIQIGDALQHNYLMIIAIAILLVVIFSLLTVLGIRTYTTVVWIALISCLAGSTLMCYTYIANMAPGSIQAKWDANFGTGTYQKIWDLALKTGFDPNKYWPNKFSMDATMGTALVGPFSLGQAGAIATYLGGEAKEPSKAAFQAVVGSAILIFGYALLVTYLTTRVYGNFLNAYIWCYYNARDDLSKILGRPAFLANMGSMASPLWPGNTTIQIFFPFLIAWYITKDLPAFALFASRNLFAYAFDRFLPEKIAEVNPRFNSPHWAIFLTCLLAFYGVIGGGLSDMGLPGYGSWFFGGEFSILWNLQIVFGCLAAALLPLLRKDLYQTAFPKSIAGIPLVTIFGTIGFTMNFFLIIACAGKLPAESLAATLLWYGIGLAIFIAYWLYNEKRGIDPRVIYGQIPPA